MLAVLDDVSDAAVRDTAIRFAKGEVNGQELRFAPTPAEFRKVCREYDDKAQHTVWLEQNRASVQPLPMPVHKRPIREGVRDIIEQYRANYRERLKTEPNLKYTDSIRRDFASATGKELKLPDPKAVKSDVAWQPLPPVEDDPQYAGFAILHDNISHVQYRKMLKRGQLPNPHFFVASAGVIYGGLHPKLVGKGRAAA